MSDTLPQDSVGLVKPEFVEINQPFRFQAGNTLPGFRLCYETYGELNKARTNAILVCPALSGDHHAAGLYDLKDERPGWWDAHIGPGKPIDTSQFFVVALNNLGGCAGSTGPTEENPETGAIWGKDFPAVTVKDWVRSQALLADHLDIDQWLAVIGGSLGGMQAIQWAIDYPLRICHAIAIASAPTLTAQNIGFNYIARKAITSDPDYLDGQYREQGKVPKEGLKLARMVGHMTYQSDGGLVSKFGADRFGRDLQKSDANDRQFKIESYLQHQGTSFSEKFDANTYLLMTNVLDDFDPAKDYDNDLAKALSHAECKFLLISFTSDWRFSIKRSEEIMLALMRANKSVANVVIESDKGHDAFLLSEPCYNEVVRTYLNRAMRDLKDITT